MEFAELTWEERLRVCLAAYEAVSCDEGVQRRWAWQSPDLTRWEQQLNFDVKRGIVLRLLGEEFAERGGVWPEWTPGRQP
jgi:hypothetical protein